MVLLEERQTRGFESVRLPGGVEKRMAWLDSGDRKLLQLSIRGTLTRRELAMLIGRSSGSITRRVQRLLARLNDPLVAALVESGELLPELSQEVGLAYFLRDWSIREIGKEFDLPMYQVKQVLQYVRGWYEAKRAVGGRR